jgi:hypothetical protein
LFKEIITVYSLDYTKTTNIICGENAELMNVKAGVNIVTTGF